MTNNPQSKINEEGKRIFELAEYSQFAWESVWTLNLFIKLKAHPHQQARIVCKGIEVLPY